MKALSALFLILSLSFTSCSTISTNTGDEARLIPALNAIVDAWNRRDASQLETRIADDFVRTSHGKVHFTGRKGYVDLMRAFSASFPDQKVVLERTTVKGNQVFTSWTVSGTNTGAFLGNRPTGARVAIHGFSVWTFNANGALAREDAYWNDLDTLTQMGFAVSANSSPTK